ncbi:MAG TPA: amidohydrolase, partial [Xanthomonadales bacterium]|nr:amidohydrolase [Xanthomonadales bacterium]
GIDAGTENPVGGVIVRDAESGEATGTLRESAMTLVDEVTPVASARQQAADLATGLAEAARFGITAFTEPGLSAAQLAPYVEADQNRTLTARVLVSLTPIGTSVAPFDESVYELVEQRESFNGNYLKTDSVKVFMDGVIETKTSYMLEPYTDDQSNFEALYDQDTANEFYQKLDAMGVQVHTHAIGDGAIRRALNAYEYALEQNGPSDSRHQIAHLQLIDPADIPRFGELNVAADFQPLWAYPDQYIDLAVTVVGQERVDRFYPIASIDATGGLIIGGSDWSVSSLNPLDAIEVAVTRQDPNATGGRIHQESERVDLATILDAYTRNGAWVMKLDDQVGSIEVGKRADLIVLDKNLFDIPTEDINTSKVLVTMMDGKIIYQAE